MLFLIVGGYKTGKTVSASTFPKPILWLDWENGFKSVETVKPQYLPDIKKISFYKQQIYDLSFVTDVGSKMSPPFTQDSPRFITEFNNIIKELGKNGCITETGVELGLGPNVIIPIAGPTIFTPKTLVIDSLTAMFQIWKESILKMNSVSSLRIQDYGTLENVLVGQFIPAMKSLSESGKIENIVLIDHIDSDKDEITGQLSEFPVGPSRNMGKSLGRHFDEIYLQKQEGQDYVWRTRKNGLFQAGSRLNLPELIKPATYDELSKYLPKKA